ncbi:hypothetical protein [Pontiella agarivorans]|uniref:hypothetical protein n=1 Tax=Pontiella agarivorans TaxID=3038953 RepID=UPI002AD46FC2|nr:hypothetical protein [Pontiella agarivorans]
MRLDERTDLQKSVFGANCLLIGRPVWYDHPEFIKRYEEAGTPFFRFPGGTPANYYNPFKGINDEIPESGRDYARRNQEILERTNGKGQTPAGFFRFAKKTEARYSVVVNMSTLSVEENKKWLTEAKRRGADIAAFELGNELYFGSYRWAFQTPEDYLECAKKTTGMLRRIYPKAKIGVLVPSHIYTDESFLSDDVPAGLRRQEEWMEMLRGEDFFDSVVIHLYNTVGMDGKTKRKNFLPYPEAYKHALAHLNHSLDITCDLLENEFPGKSIWITEYGLGGFSGDLRSYKLRGSHLGGLFSGLMLMKFFERPSVEVSSWHSFSHFFDYIGGEQGLGEEPHLLYHHFKFFAEPVNKSDYYAPVNIAGCRKREGTPRHPGQYPEVEGGGFFSRSGGYLVLINKLDTPYRLDQFEALYKGRQRKVTFVRGLQLRPREDQELSTALRDQVKLSEVEFEGADLNAVEIAPYSITRLEFEWR